VTGVTLSRGLVVVAQGALVGAAYLVLRSAVVAVLDPVTAEALAVAAAALLFRPLYVRVERLVDRLLYGARPTPYSVLAGITATWRSTTGDAPDMMRVAEAVGRGLDATTCRLTVRRPGLHDRTYTWTTSVRATDDLLEIPVRRGDEQIGSLAVDRAAVAGVHAQRATLFADIADSLGVVLQASRFGVELERQLRAALAHAHEIAVSRREAVAEMDRERRRIERNLHDGAQHHLVSLRLTLGLVEHQVSTGRLDEAANRLTRLAEQIDVAESVMAETAAGVSSPVLAELGLVRALARELAGGVPSVAFAFPGLDPDHRFPPDIESAAYFCCLESVNNARKHAADSAVSVRVTVQDGRLLLTTTDDGPGWDAEQTAAGPGRGLRNMTARITAVGGRLGVRTAPGAGTTVEISVAVPAPPAEPTPGPATPSAMARSTLLDQLRGAVSEALNLYHDTPHSAALRTLAERFDEPLRIGVAGPEGAGTTTLVDALVGASNASSGSAVRFRRAGDPPAWGQAHETATLVDVHGLGSALPSVRQRARDQLGAYGQASVLCDAYLFLLRDRCPDDPRVFSVVRRGPVPHRPAHAIGVLARADELPGPQPAGTERARLAAARCAVETEVRQLCRTVVPVSVLPRRTAPDTDGGGLPTLVNAMAVRFLARATTLRARSTMRALETLALTDPPPGGAGPLLYRLDRIRSGAHELTEIDMIDGLRDGDLDIPDHLRSEAERLLGAHGTDPSVRLSLPSGATDHDVARAAEEFLLRWRTRESHPASTRDVRTLAAALVRTCEQFLTAGPESSVNFPHSHADVTRVMLET